MMLMATTNELCQEVAAIPFLWVLPLCLYLLTFILVFQSDRIYNRADLRPASPDRALRRRLRPLQRLRRSHLDPDRRLLHRPLRLLHGPPRRARPRQARPFAPDFLLPDDLRRRSRGRDLRRADRPGSLPRFLGVPPRGLPHRRPCHRGSRPRRRLLGQSPPAMARVPRFRASAPAPSTTRAIPTSSPPASRAACPSGCSSPRAAAGSPSAPASRRSS